VSVTQSQNVLVDGLTFRQNSGLAFSISHSRDVTVRNSVSEDNGGSGMSAWKVTNSVWKDSAVRRNNWRGDLGGYREFAVAGIKVHYMDGMHVSNFEAIDNLADGFWIDLQNQGIIFEDSLIAGNLRCGIFTEVSWGESIYRNNRIERNPWGFAIKGTPGGLLEGNTFHANLTALIVISEKRRFGNSAEIKPLTLWNNLPVDWIVRNNTFVNDPIEGSELANSLARQHPPSVKQFTSGQPQRVISFGIDGPGQSAFLKTVKWDANIYKGPAIFRLNSGKSLDPDGFKQAMQEPGRKPPRSSGTPIQPWGLRHPRSSGISRVPTR
jgi:hypothetical protein